jgi:hypothetical protein
VQGSFLKEDEIVDQMYGRLRIIINELNSLGKTYIAPERVRKILRCLPKSWRYIVTTITEAKNLTKLKLEDLVESLKARESILQEEKPMKKNTIALESQTEECSQNEVLCDDDFLKEDNEEKLPFLSRRIQNLLMRRNQPNKSFPSKRNGSKSKVDMSQIGRTRRAANVCLMTNSDFEVTFEPCAS